MLFPQREIVSVRPLSPASFRTALTRRLGRVRFAWFLLGIMVGAGICYYFVSLLHHNPEMSQRQDMAPAFALLESRLAPLPAPLAMVSTASAVPALKPSAPALMLPARYSFSLRPGEALSLLLIDKGVGQDEAAEIVRSIKHVYNPRSFSPSQTFDVRVYDDKYHPGVVSVGSISIAVSPVKTVTLTRTADERFLAKEMQAPVYKELARAGGDIHSSLYQTGVDSGIPAQMLFEIIQAFSYDVDFQRDIREGDGIDVVFERTRTDKGVTTGYGKILYASLRLGDEELTVYRHVTADGFAGYYNIHGDSVKKALLKTPINGAHITSGFGMRMHPLLGYSKMHKGIDFGAAIGTPIYAAGDGVIAEAGRKGGYGNYVRVKHSSNYETAYGHASRIARGIRPGVHVSQGQVIAYVGSTGFSTGPHLHYEILIGGKQVNPSGVKFRTGQTLGGHELTAFKQQVHQVQVALNTLPRNRQVAALEQH